MIEVSRGWERFNVRVDVRGDIFYAISGLDLFVNMPVSITEALVGTSVEVATFDRSARVDVPPMFKPGTEIRIPKKGVSLGSEGPGDLLAYPFIAPPTKMSEPLKETVAVIAAQYGAQKVRERSPATLEDMPGARLWDMSTILPIPATLQEAVYGFSVEIPTASGRETVKFAGPWKADEVLVLERKGFQVLPEVGPGDLIVFPEVILPSAIGPETFTAANVLDQQSTASVRASMPRKLQTTTAAQPKR
jgi:DnaJ-class molecular chaperone